MVGLRLEVILDARRRLGISQDADLTTAVRRFQMEQRLLVTGKLDEETLTRLWEVRLLQPDTRKPRG